MSHIALILKEHRLFTIWLSGSSNMMLSYNLKVFMYSGSSIFWNFLIVWGYYEGDCAPGMSASPQFYLDLSWWRTGLSVLLLSVIPLPLLLHIVMSSWIMFIVILCHKYLLWKSLYKCFNLKVLSVSFNVTTQLAVSLWIWAFLILIYVINALKKIQRTYALWYMCHNDYVVVVGVERLVYELKKKTNSTSVWWVQSNCSSFNNNKISFSGKFAS